MPIDNPGIEVSDRYPRPIAWGFSEVSRARDLVARFHRLLELAEETIRYVTLVEFARYLDLRPSTHDHELDNALLKLHSPSFGDWVKALDHLDRYFARHGDFPFGISLSVSGDHPSMLELANQVRGRNQKKISLLRFFESLVTLRNNTRGHGSIGEVQANLRGGQLFKALIEMLGVLDPLSLHPPVLIKSIDYHGPKSFQVSCCRFG